MVCLHSACTCTLNNIYTWFLEVIYWCSGECFLACTCIVSGLLKCIMILVAWRVWLLPACVHFVWQDATIVEAIQ